MDQNLNFFQPEYLKWYLQVSFCFPKWLLVMFFSHVLPFCLDLYLYRSKCRNMILSTYAAIKKLIFSFLWRQIFRSKFFQLKCLCKVLDALFMMIQDNKALADFGSPCSLSTINVKYKNQRQYGVDSENSFGIRSYFWFWLFLVVWHLTSDRLFVNI